MLKRLLLLSSICFSLTYTFAQTQVVTGVMNGKDYGVAYILPKTVLEVNIKTEKYEYTPGEFAKFANRYLQLTNIEQASSTSWNIQKVDVNVVGKPDSDKSFFVKLKDKSIAPNLELTSDGIIKSINTPCVTINKESTPNVTMAVTTNVDPKKYYTEEILMANSTAKIAELVAKEIYAIRESRNNLLRGDFENAPTDGEFLKVMLKNMNIQENALLSLFVGRTDTISVDKKIELEIDTDVEDLVIARFSHKQGLVDSDNLVGEPIYLSIKDLKSINIPVDDGKGKKKMEGIAYNLPGRALIEVYYFDKLINKKEVSLTQFGIVEYLAPSLFNKKSPIQVFFDTTTGALLKVNKEE